MSTKPMATGILTLTIAVTQDDRGLWGPSLLRALREVADGHEANPPAERSGAMAIEGGEASWIFQSAPHYDLNSMRVVGWETLDHGDEVEIKPIYTLGEENLT